MPRPRVLPANRRRTALACNFCREVKKRCSGSVPCTHCLRRGIASQCCIGPRPAPASQPVPAPAPAPLPPPVAPSPGEPASADASSVRDVGRVTPGKRGRQVFRPPTPSDSRRSVDAPRTPRQQQPTPRPAPSSLPASSNSRMLLNLRGERVYIGGAASLSFLQIVRQVVAEQIGPSQFSHNAQSDTMLEKELAVPDLGSPSSGAPPLDASTKLALSRAFAAATAGFIDIFAPSEIETALADVEETSNRQPAQRRTAVFDLVLAIGAQVRSSEEASSVGQPYFRRARQQAFEGMLEDPDLDVVRSFLLMAFYLLGHCRRNSAFMYLGIATRAAVALGLHNSRESQADMTSPEKHLRLRVWISLRIVDMLVSSILGRPAATAGLGFKSIIDDMSEISQDDDTKRLIASHQIVSIINIVVDTLYERKELSTALVEQLLSEIQAWEKEMVACLRSAPAAAERTDDLPHRSVIGKIHVSCLYYFAVTLATRPVLMSTLTSQPASGGLARPLLASACLDAAVFLVQSCNEARNAGHLYGNMCIMKALVFAAGLVLGFEIFAKRSVDHAIESAFSGARDLLNFFATQSPQAAHYHDILTLLANAVAKQRETSASRGRSRYVSKIFTLGRGDEAPERQAERELEGQPPSPTGFAPIAPELGGDGWLCGSATPADDGDDMLFGWDSLEISHWDSFPFVT
ncbi:hypothetical protein CDD83_4219 [Cordyceps sp. RAO-2017]|nr:hypothetical protein CDD83_4219 [Cordyceps sp. RAO-2017]